MSLSTYYLKCGRHLARLRRRRRRRRRCHRRRRRAYARTSNTASHENHEKINSWVSFSSYMSMGLRLATFRVSGAPLNMSQSAREELDSFWKKDSVIETRCMFSVS